MDHHLYQNLYQSQILVVSFVLVVQVVFVILLINDVPLIVLILLINGHIINHHIILHHVHLNGQRFSVTVGFCVLKQLLFILGFYFI